MSFQVSFHKSAASIHNTCTSTMFNIGLASKRVHFRPERKLCEIHRLASIHMRNVLVRICTMCAHLDHGMNKTFFLASTLLDSLYLCMDGWMDVCMYVCVCQYIHRIHIHTHTHTHTYTHTYVFTRVHTNMYIQVHRCVHTRTLPTHIQTIKHSNTRSIKHACTDKSAKREG